MRNGARNAVVTIQSMYQLNHNTPYAGVHNIKVMLGNINIK